MRLNKENLSFELQLLISIVQQEFCKNNLEVDLNQVNWDSFRKLSSYHGMRSFAYKSNQKKTFLPLHLERQFKNLTVKQAKLSLENIVETKRLYDLFSEVGVYPILLKGNLFTNLLYQNQVLRESTDIDFLFKKEEALRGIDVLMKEGYLCRNFGPRAHPSNLKQEIDHFISLSNFQELHFDKKPFNIDVHWELCNLFLNYKVDLSLFFEHHEVLNFYEKKIPISNSNATLWSLILHHGGKELWLKFKNLADLMAFMRRYQEEVDWDLVLHQAKDYKLQYLLKMGFYLIKHVFDFHLPERLEQELIGFKPSTLGFTIDFWEKSNYWNKAIPRLKYERIMHCSQDEGYTISNYIQKLYSSYAESNPFEYNRILNFGKKWKLFNFLSKMISYLWRASR